jgi:16S rRNA (guanine966-N2)-methyltransferase
MRIIAGEHRGRRIEAPPGRDTRPMLDRVREALFGTLGERILDARVLDLFAGTGSLALEALSRGATRARLIESDARTLRLLRENVRRLGLEERCEIASGDALAPRLWRPRLEGAEPLYDIVFLDPPYPFVDHPGGRRALLDALERLAAEHLAPGGILVLHARRARLQARDFPPELDARLREYGTNAIWYFTGRVAEESQP